jgi:hypothetical protein
MGHPRFENALISNVLGLGTIVECCRAAESDTMSVVVGYGFDFAFSH